ncbi:MAG: nucleotide sugar dehydrogenase, partial [Ktedonobacteraceae bacterium]|nr:nucleotide sugar dehydrogenase [Ktedonobacteraceae bacterium]
MQENSSTTVAVIGLGKIGLPLAVQYARHGRRVIGCDIDVAIVESVNAGQSHVHEEPELAGEVAALVQQGLLSATAQTTQAVRQAGVVIVIVPVVIDEQHEVSFQSLD